MRLRLAVLALLLTPSAFAFDYDEHKYLSNLALRAALDMAPKKCGQLGDAERFLDAQAIQDRRSFGDLTSLGDYVRSVDVYFERNGSLDMAVPRYGDINWERITGLKRDLLRFLQSAHLNETHFQQAALITHMNGHAAAIALAKAGNVHRALMIEAHALHFLGDFHAPGHISATRAGMVDYVALASHGKYNNAGLRYGYKEKSKELLTIVDHFIANAERFKALRHEKLDLNLGREDFKALREDIDGGHTVTFVGDSQLKHKQSQAAYIAVLATRSLLDVIEAACLPAKEKHSFVPNCWILGPVGPRTIPCKDDPIPNKGIVRVASIPYGKYDAAEHRFHRVWFKPWDVNLASYYTEARFGESEGRARRGQVGIESLLFSVIGPGVLEQYDGANTLTNLLADVNASLAYGYSWVSGDRAHGAHIRSVVAFPRIDIQFTTSYGVRWYETAGGTVRRYPIGVGLETGYGFIFLHLGVSHEFFYSPLTDEVRNHQLVKTGITFVLPTKTGVDWIGKKIRGK